MKVSIITSAYNCDSYIKEMIDSIINQTCRDWEMVLVDDASDDNTWDVIDGIKDSRIVKIRNQVNKGLTKNLNMALDIARGKYIIRMDTDDLAMPDRIEKQVQFMEQNSDTVLSGCWMQCFGRMHDIIKPHLNDDDIRIDLIFNSAVMHPTFIVRNEVLKKYSIKYDEKLKYAQDYDFTYRISKFGKLANIPQILVKYRVHSGQVSSEHNERQKRCADITRRKIVQDIGIDLNDDEFGIWSDFCLGKTERYSEKERRILTQITEQLLCNNRVESIYNNRKLEHIMSERLRIVAMNKAGNAESLTDLTLEIEKYKRLFGMMSRWVIIRQSGKSLIEWFLLRDYQSVAIYGMGDVGECLAGELRNSPINVVYGIDRNSWISCSLEKVVSPGDELKKVDVIIITAVSYIDEIKKILAGRIECPLISIEDIIYDITL